MTSIETPLFSEMLRQELARRSARNPRYSLRAFAKSVDASPAFLSRVLAGKRTPSAKMARQLADSLGFSGAERKKFVASVAAFRASAPLDQELDESTAATTRLENDLYDVIGDLNHLAILEMTFTDGFKSDPRAIARELGITALEARVLIGRLLATGLMEEKDGRYVATNRSTTTKDKSRTTTALRRNQRQILEKALHSLMHDDYEVRHMSGMTMAIDPKKMPLARTLIQKFMDDLAEVLGDGRKTDVYQLGVSLYPLQRKRGATCAK